MAHETVVDEVITRVVVTCDRCGQVVSDGRHDGLGGTNFWGAWADLVRHVPDKDAPAGVAFKKDTRFYPGAAFEGVVLSIALRFTPVARWVLCHECAKDLTTFVDTKIVRSQNGGGAKS